MRWRRRADRTIGPVIGPVIDPFIG